MARGGAGGHQRDQSTRLEAPRTVQLAGARSRKRTPEVIDLLSEEEEDGDYGARKSRSCPAHTRPEATRPAPIPAPVRPARSTDLQMYSVLQGSMVAVTRDRGKYPCPVLSYMRRLMNLADYVRGQEPCWSSGTTTPNIHILWVSVSALPVLFANQSLQSTAQEKCKSCMNNKDPCTIAVGLPGCLQCAQGKKKRCDVTAVEGWSNTGCTLGLDGNALLACGLGGIFWQPVHGY